MPSRTRTTAASSSRSATYTISDLAREFALTTRAIRFYEDSGLIAPAREGRARVYGERERV
ncbi:MAG: MerR family transcriptional regulator, partial [Casimicrobiaceae bacterium]